MWRWRMRRWTSQNRKRMAGARVGDQVHVRAVDFGGPDKCSSGHRYDSTPFANGRIK